MKINILLWIVLAFIFTGCEETPTILPSGKVVKIGVLAPLSGQDIRLGHQSLLGLKVANKMRKYLSNGDEVVLKIIDNQSNIKSAKQALSNLHVEKVEAIFSFMSSKEMRALSKNIHDTKIPFIATLATDNNIAKEDTYISQVCINNNTQVIVAAHYIRDEKFMQNVGVVYNKNSFYSKNLATEFKKYFLRLGGSVDFFIDVGSNKGLKKFKNYNKTNTKMIFNTTDAKITLKILKLIAAQKRKCKLLGTDGLLSGALEFSKADLKLFDGVYVIEHYSHDVGRNNLRKKFESLLSEDGYKESSYALLAYDGYQLLMNTLNKCQDYNKLCIKNALENSTTIKGISSNFSIVDSQSKREVYVNKINNSQLLKEVVIY